VMIFSYFNIKVEENVGGRIILASIFFISQNNIGQFFITRKEIMIIRKIIRLLRQKKLST